MLSLPLTLRPLMDPLTHFVGFHFFWKVWEGPVYVWTCIMQIIINRPEKRNAFRPRTGKSARSLKTFGPPQPLLNLLVLCRCYIHVARRAPPALPSRST